MILAHHWHDKVFYKSNYQHIQLLLSTTVFQADIPVDILNTFKLRGYKDLLNNSWDGRDGTKIHAANERRSVWAKRKSFSVGVFLFLCSAHRAPVPEFFRSWFTLAIAFPAKVLGSPMGQFQIITEKFVVALNCPQHPFPTRMQKGQQKMFHAITQTAFAVLTEAQLLQVQAQRLLHACLQENESPPRHRVDRGDKFPKTM